MPDAAGNHFGPLDVVVSPDAEDYTESTWYRLSRRSGVLSGGAVTFDGRTVTLAPVDAYVAGGFFYRDAPQVVGSSPATTGANPRRDMLVLRSTLSSGTGAGAVAGKTVPVLLQGAPASSPVDPPLGARDEPIASWMVPGSGGSALTAGRDLRRWLRTDELATWKPGFEFYRTSGSLGDGGLEGQGFALTDVVADTHGFYRSGMNFAVVPAGMGGLYDVSVGITLDGNTLGRLFANLYRNTGPGLRAESYLSDTAWNSRPIRLSAGQVLALNAFQQSGGGNGKQITGLHVSAWLIGT